MKFFGYSIVVVAMAFGYAMLQKLSCFSSWHFVLGILLHSHSVLFTFLRKFLCLFLFFVFFGWATDAFLHIKGHCCYFMSQFNPFTWGLSFLGLWQLRVFKSEMLHSPFGRHIQFPCHGKGGVKAFAIKVTVQQAKRMKVVSFVPK